MSLTPAPLPELAYSRFRFEPAIAGVEHNEWTLRRATWTEMVVVNARGGQELAVPRRYLGRIVETGDSIRGVRLVEALECHAGRVRPVRRGVIEMGPRREGEAAPWLRREAGNPAPVIAIRVEAARPSSIRRALRGSVAVGLIAFLALVCIASLIRAYR